MLEIIVNATTANLGPGFDCMGLALAIENKVTIQKSNEEFIDKKNLIYLSIKKIFDIAGKETPNFKIEQQIQIPISRGLGSSAACIAAGCLAGNVMAHAKLSTDDLIKIATAIEGHPDNIVPAFLGGYTISSLEDEEVIYFRQDACKNFKYAVIIPNFTLSTTLAREALPSDIPFKDGVYNIGKSALLSASMITGNGNLLKYACKDKVHQPYRKHLIPEFDNIIKKAESYGALASFLSGAGPSIVSILSFNDNDFENKMSEFLKSIQGGWVLKIVKASNMGARVNLAK